jgi:hypothetical protein
MANAITEEYMKLSCIRFVNFGESDTASPSVASSTTCTPSSTSTASLTKENEKISDDVQTQLFVDKSKSELKPDNQEFFDKENISLNSTFENDYKSRSIAAMVTGNSTLHDLTKTPEKRKNV